MLIGHRPEEWGLRERRSETENRLSIGRSAAAILVLSAFAWMIVIAIAIGSRAIF
jgi:hypothetical protein